MFLILFFALFFFVFLFSSVPSFVRVQVCFVPGMLALGAHSGAVEGAEADRHMELAKQLMRTCYEFYARQPTGLAPEIVQFRMDGSAAAAAATAGVSSDAPPAFTIDGRATHSLLRPETVESLFVMWRVTGDPLYREWGWKIFESFRTFARVDGAGYSGLKDVRVTNRPTPRPKAKTAESSTPGPDGADLESEPDAESEPEVWANWNDKMEVRHRDGERGRSSEGRAAGAATDWCRGDSHATRRHRDSIRFDSIRFDSIRFDSRRLCAIAQPLPRPLFRLSILRCLLICL